tara:strand:+ start:1487 stop:2689 length:1203 start_codon:yes stop_codon:yes gene_type:complete
MAARKITILGSTGSVGINTLDVVSRYPNRYQIIALTANKSTDKMLEQCRIFHPDYAVMRDPISAENLKEKINKEKINTKVLCGIESLEKVASLPEVDIVMAAIVGAAGIRPTFAAALTGKYVLLANKETLVMAGKIFMDIVKKNHATLLPIDSEHNAIFQSLPNGFTGEHKKFGIRKILLTASGGPFRKSSLSEIKNVTPEEACNHPNWVMGKKISVDSATMMNKGLELIEAHWLFDAKPENIQVVIHPQSIIHSMVEYIDGSILAQLGNPDMRTPIAHALAYPDRIECGTTPLDIFKVASLDFEKPNFTRFPCLNLAYKALSSGGSAPTVLNAANEVAVEAFLESSIPFTEIPSIIEKVMEIIKPTDIFTLEDILEIDDLARNAAYKLIDSKKDTHKLT